MRARRRFCHTSVSCSQCPVSLGMCWNCLTVCAPGSKTAELDDIQDCASSDTANVLRRVRGNEHLRSDGVTDTVGDEEDSRGDCLFGSARNV